MKHLRGGFYNKRSMKIFLLMFCHTQLIHQNICSLYNTNTLIQHTFYTISIAIMLFGTLLPSVIDVDCISVLDTDNALQDLFMPYLTLNWLLIFQSDIIL